jgi:hypothetical protein
MRSSGPQARRRRLAALACLLWILGIEVLPNAHLAMHGRLGAHRHDAGESRRGDGGIVVRVHRDSTSHVHDGVVHAHGDAAAASPAPDVRAIGAPDGTPPPGHGDHSLAHRRAALAAPPPVIDAPLPVDHRPQPATYTVALLTAAAPPPDAAARSPPVHG